MAAAADHGILSGRSRLPPPPSKLPESLLVALGLLACDPKDDSGVGPCLDTDAWVSGTGTGAATDSVGPCLDTDNVPVTGTGTGATSDTSGLGTETGAGTGTGTGTGGTGTGATDTWSGTDTIDTGPCLDTAPRHRDTSDTHAIGPCLDTADDTARACLLLDTYVGPDTDHPTGDGPVSAAGPPGLDRRAVRDRVLASEVLPADVAARLATRPPRE